MSAPPPSSKTGISPGIVVDRYEVLAPLGRGGFGQVYRARHVHTQAVVALKVLRSGAASAPRALERLFREARIMASVDHPNIVKVFDCGAVEGRAFVAMELVEGRTLEDMIVERGRLPSETVIGLGAQLFAGLEAAHERGVIHRDIKPANVLVDKHGILKILDFGISRAELDDPTLGATQGGVVVGTPGFMAPEQYTLGPIDARADLYAASATLFSAVAGHPPFSLDARVAEIAAKVLHERAPPLASVVPGVVPSLAAAVDRGLARDPDARFATASAFRSALTGSVDRSIGTAATRAAPTSDPPRASTGPRMPHGSTAPLAFTPAAVSPSSAPMTPSSSSMSASSPMSDPQGQTLSPTTGSHLSQRGTSPGWVLAGVAVGALVLVCGAVIGAIVSNARAKKELAQPSPAPGPAPGGSTGRGGVLGELDKEGVIINPPVIEKKGHFTTTQVCDGPNDMRFVEASFDVKEGPALVVRSGCEVTLVSPTIKAPVGIRVQGAGEVTVRGGRIMADSVGIDFDGNALELNETHVEGDIAIRQTGAGKVMIRKAKLVGRTTGYILGSGLDSTLDDTTLEAPSALLAEGGHLIFHRGSITGTPKAFDIGGLSEVEYFGTQVKGATVKRGALAKLVDGNVTPMPTVEPKTLKAGDALVKLPGIVVNVPLVSPEGIDMGSFVQTIERAAPSFRACKGSKGSSVRLLVSISGPEMPGKDHRIGSVLGNPPGPVSKCVADAFRVAVPDPYLQAGATRTLIFDVVFD